MPQTHTYTSTDYNLCTNSENMNALMAKGESAPGAPAAQDNATTNMTLPPLSSLWGGGGQSFLPADFFTPNPIQQTVSSANGTIANTALAGHIFWPGAANIAVTPARGVGSFIQTSGSGSGKYPILNNLLGYAFFGLRNFILSVGCNFGSGTAAMAN